MELVTKEAPLEQNTVWRVLQSQNLRLKIKILISGMIQGIIYMDILFFTTIVSCLIKCPESAKDGYVFEDIRTLLSVTRNLGI